MTIEAGQMLLHYRLAGKLGAGGMGVVWKAVDTTLDREVAIKVLPAEFAEDGERLARFEREAKLLASLNHPNIASVHGFDESGGERFLVLEYVEGETLASHLDRGPIAVEDALDIAKQLSEALEAAHERGIIHRDLKPANVMIRPDGSVKVLDFGLAKAMVGDSSSAEPTNSPTITANFTRAGTVLGTAAYMSPEQARGRELDKRTDIWSLGIILFECFTGESLFRGETAHDSIGAIMHKDPDWSLLPSGTPPTIQLLLRRCLTRDRKRRLHDVADARIELENALVDPSSTSLGLAQVALDVKSRRLPSWQTLAGIGLLLALTAVVVWFAKPAPPQAPRRSWNLSLLLPEDKGYRIAPWGRGVAISSDGLQVAFVVYPADSEDRRQRLYLRRTDQATGVILANTEGAIDASFSPDGDWIAFTTRDSLKKISTRGGPASTIYPAGNFLTDPEWGEDDTIVFVEYIRDEGGGGVRRVSANGGTPERLTVLEKNAEVYHTFPHFLSDDSGITFSTGRWNMSWDDPGLFALRFGDAEPTEVMRGGNEGISLATGHLVYRRENTLMAAPFDLARLEIVAPAVPVLEGVGGARTSDSSRLDISRSGTLVFLPDADGAARERSLTWVDHDGSTTPASTVTREYRGARLSPDGEQMSIVIRSGEGEQQGIYILERKRDLLRRVTSDPAAANSVWSSDEEWILFSSRVDGNTDLFRIPTDFSGEAERLDTSEHDRSPTDMSPNGRLLAINDDTPGGKGDVVLLHLDAEGRVDGEITPIATSPEWEGDGRFSPDGRWVSYASYESGRAEAYVTASSGGGAAVQVSTEGAYYVRWSPVANKLYFSKTWRTDEIYSVSFSTGDGVFSPELPELVFKLDATDLDPREFEVAPDGQRFLLSTRADPGPSLVVKPRIIVNWFEELEAKAPIDEPR